MPKRRRERFSRLALKIYLIGLAQFFVVAFGMDMQRRANKPSQPHPRDVMYVADTLSKVADDPAQLQYEFARVQRTLGWWIEMRDGDDKVIVRSKGDAPAVSESTGPHGTVPFQMKDGTFGHFSYAFFWRIQPPSPMLPITLVLIVVGLASWALARALTGPLQQLSGAARAFGMGRLDQRLNMSRKDEMGEVARAFDDMADRIARLLLAERELLANVSHELRTPLARIRVALDIAYEGDPKEALQTLHEITEDLAELERIVDDVLASARLALEDESRRGSASLPVRREVVDLGLLLDKAAAKFKGMHSNRKLEMIVADELPEIMGDAVLVRRVIDNLLDNAHKYTPTSDSPIVLRAKREGEQAIIEVEDRGIGVDEADLGRLFEPFFRVDRSRTRSTGGLGLGLALARRVVDAHGGRIWFTSKVGEGTVAHVALPSRIESQRVLDAGGPESVPAPSLS